MGKRTKSLGTIFISAAIIIAIVAVFFGRKRAAPCAGCNVIVISVGTFRADSLPCYGYAKQTAPEICAFAKNATLYERAYATASKTLDASFSLLTGLYPSAHGMTVPFVSVLNPAIVTLPQLAKGKGYRTIFMGPSGDPHIPISLGFGRGFGETYDADDPASWTAVFRSLTGIRNTSGRPFFAYLHSYMLHEPYTPDETDIRRFYKGTPPVVPTSNNLCAYTYGKIRVLHPERLPETKPANACEVVEAYRKTYSGSADFDETYAMTNDAYWHEFDGLSDTQRKAYTKALYDARLYEFDREFGRFMTYAADAGFLHNTIVVLTGDHGDEFFEHGGYSHGYTLYEEVIRIPLIISVPGTLGSRSQKLASTVDIMPTVLALTGLRVPPKLKLPGIDLYSMKQHSMIIAEHVSDKLFAVTSSGYAYIVDRSGPGKPAELYSLRTDGTEQRNVYRNMPGIAAVMERGYQKLVSLFSVYRPIQNPFPGWLLQEQRDRLIKTGYF